MPTNSQQNCNMHTFQLEDNDVVVGIGTRSTMMYTHPGNVRLERLVQSNLDDYCKANTKPEKSKILMSIIQQIRSKNGRFAKLHQDSSHGEQWVEVGNALAREKVSRMFRNALHGKYKSSVISRKNLRRRLKAGEDSTKHSKATTTPSSNGDILVAHNTVPKRGKRRLMDDVLPNQSRSDGQVIVDGYMVTLFPYDKINMDIEPKTLTEIVKHDSNANSINKDDPNIPDEIVSFFFDDLSDRHQAKANKSIEASHWSDSHPPSGIEDVNHAPLPRSSIDKVEHVGIDLNNAPKGGHDWITSSSDVAHHQEMGQHNGRVIRDSSSFSFSAEENQPNSCERELFFWPIHEGKNVDLLDCIIEEL